MVINHPYIHIQSSQNLSVLSDMTSKILADFAKDWHKIGICNRKLMRTDIFSTRTTKPIFNFVNPACIFCTWCIQALNSDDEWIKQAFKQWNKWIHFLPSFRFNVCIPVHAKTHYFKISLLSSVNTGIS